MSKRLLFIIAALLFVSAGAFAQVGGYSSTATDTTGKRLSLPTVKVCADALCSTTATIYKDAAKTALANPFTGDAQGNYSFYAAPGSYFAQVAKAGFATVTIPFSIGGVGDVVSSANNVLTGNNTLTGSNILSGLTTFTKGVAVTGGLGATQLSVPSAPTVTPTCTGTCATTYSYQVTARDLAGETQPTASVTTATGAATLTTSAFNTISTSTVAGAQSCAIYRTAGGVNQGFIGTVTCGSSLVDNGLNSCTGSCSSPYIAPTQNTTGGIGAHLPTTVFMGDSRTRGITFSLTNLFPNQPWINRGRGGDKCADEDGRFAAEVVAIHPAAVLINCGTNDFWNTTGTPAAGSVFTTAENAITDMVNQALAAGIVPILSTVPPVRPGVSQPIVAQMNTDLVTFNTWIKGFTAPYGGVRIIDLYGAIVDSTGQLPAAITVDGVHFNDTYGNPLVAGLIRSYLPNPGAGGTFFGERSILNASQLNGGWCVYNLGAPNLVDYEKGCLVVNSNGFDFAAIKTGAGVARPIRLKSDNFLSFGSTVTSWWLIDGNSLRPGADNTYDFGAAATNRIRNGYFVNVNTPTLTLGTEAITKMPRMAWSPHVEASSASGLQASAGFTLDNAITITRFQAYAPTAAAGCATAGVLSVTDGTTNYASLTIANGGFNFDSGALTANVAAGVNVFLKWTTSSAGCGTQASPIATTVQYKMQ